MTIKTEEQLQQELLLARQAAIQICAGFAEVERHLARMRRMLAHDLGADLMAVEPDSDSPIAARIFDVACSVAEVTAWPIDWQKAFEMSVGDMGYVQFDLMARVRNSLRLRITQAAGTND